MIYEYAIEPEFLIEVSDNLLLCQLIQQSLQGTPANVLSNYPKQITKVVYKKLQAEVKNSPENEKSSWQKKEQHITELLRIIDNTPKAKRENPAANLFEEHQRFPFHGVFSLNDSFAPCFTLSRGRESNCQFGLHPISVTAVRNQKDQSSAVAPLLQNASEITFVDPYFSGEPRYLDVYKEYFLSISKTRDIRSRSISDKIIIIAAYFPNTNKKDKKNVPYDEFKKTCEQFIDIKPLNIILEIRRIQEISGQQEIHDRYILTDIGGVKLGHGTDISRIKSTTSEVNISLLSNIDWKKWRKAYKPNSPDFNWSEEPITIECNRVLNSLQL